MDNQTLYIAVNGVEFWGPFGDSAKEGDTTGDGQAPKDPGVEIVVGDTFTLGAVVDGHNISAYINGNKIGDTYEKKKNIDFIPAIGAEFKNYNAQYTDFEFKTLATDLLPANYTVCCISGGV